MIPYNLNWGRWCRASITKHVVDTLSGISVSVEGFDRKTFEGELVELRIDGPYVKPTVVGQHHLRYEVNCLIRVSKTAYAYRINELTSKVVEAFLKGICVYKYGDGLDDTGDFLGYLQLITVGRDLIQVSNFGQIRPDVNEEQTSIEAHFLIRID